jgi:hypothetical protein
VAAGWQRPGRCLQPKPKTWRSMSMFSRETPARSGQSGSTDRGDKSSQGTPRVTSRDAVALLVLLGLNWLVVLWLFSGSASRVTIPYRPTFLAQLQEGNVDSITAQESAIDGTLKKAIRYPRSDKNAKATTEVFDARARLRGHQGARRAAAEERSRRQGEGPGRHAVVGVAVRGRIARRAALRFLLLGDEEADGDREHVLVREGEGEAVRADNGKRHVRGRRRDRRREGGAHRDRGLSARPCEVPQARRADPSWRPPQRRARHGQDVARARGGRRGRRPFFSMSASSSSR